MAFNILFLDDIMTFIGLIIGSLETWIFMSLFTLGQSREIMLKNEISGKEGPVIKSLPER
jgi:hypothetical protein